MYKVEHYNNPAAHDHFVEYPSGFTNEEIDRIREYGDRLEYTTVKLYGKHTEAAVKAAGAHFHYNEETAWIYEKMWNLVGPINESTYNYELTGFNENFYYLRYTAPDNHFNWHVDIGSKTPSPRKLSMVLQLSDPSEYDGGDFNVLVATQHIAAEKQKGLVIAFPSYKIHRVTPVIRGVRRTLTMFVTGPNFR